MELAESSPRVKWSDRGSLPSRLAAHLQEHFVCKATCRTWKVVKCIPGNTWHPFEVQSSGKSTSLHSVDNIQSTRTILQKNPRVAVQQCRILYKSNQHFHHSKWLTTTWVYNKASCSHYKQQKYNLMKLFPDKKKTHTEKLKEVAFHGWAPYV